MAEGLFSFANVAMADFLSVMNSIKTTDFYQGPDVARDEWMMQINRYMQAFRYYSGLVFDTTLGETKMAAYPLRVNIVRAMCNAQAAAVWGQWDGQLVELKADPKDNTDGAKEKSNQAVQIVQETWEASNLDQKLIEGSIAMQVYGGTYFRAYVDMQAPHGVRVDKLMPYSVFPRYHPIQTNRILEAYIVMPLDRTEASLAYGIPKDQLPEFPLYQEHWTETEYETTVNGILIKNGNGLNPWGIVPVVYIPRLRLEAFFGLPLPEDLYGLQDELNTRLADVGDKIADNAHPIRWVKNYRGNVKKDLIIDSDVIWDLGFSPPGQEGPEVGVLKSEPEPASTFEFMNFLVEMTRFASSTSPVAFGIDEGSQRSGVTLEVRLWPMLMQARVSRVYLKWGMVAINNLILKMVQASGIVIDPVVFSHLVKPVMAPLVPRDVQQVIEEISQRAAHDLISPEETVAMTGVRAGTSEDEVGRIRQWLTDRSASKRPEPGPGTPSGPTGDTSRPPQRK